MPQEETKLEFDVEVGGDPLRVIVGEYEGKKLIILRHFYTDKDTNELKPIGKGISIPLEDAPNWISVLIDLYRVHAGQSWEDGLPQSSPGD